VATYLRNLSNYSKDTIPNAADFKIGIVVSEWNDSITTNLLEGALQALKDSNVSESNILIRYVPGAFELPLATQWLLDETDVDGVIAIGVVIQGETKHFDFVCQGTTDGLMKVMLEFNSPVSFCVLTDNTLQQSIDRSGGVHGNKGIECAIACIKMIALKKSFEN
jgi:6,7-dimethyl-8-ribityllumazine synthase